MTSEKKTPLYDEHLKLHATLVPFAHTLMPVRYTSELEEHAAVRHDVGLFDVSHMGEIFVQGPDARRFLQFALTNNCEKLALGQAHYTLMLNQRGGIVDDLVLYRLEENRFLLCVNAGTIEKDFFHLTNLSAGFAIDLENASDSFAQLALQGPKSSVLLKLLSSDLAPSRFHCAAMTVDGIPALVARTGYTGEDGFELFVQPHDAVPLWTRLLEHGRHFNIKPCGLAARDLLRLEAGMLLYGQDMNDEISPINVSLMFAVDMTKPDFFGKAALVKQQALSVDKKLVGFRLLERGLARHDFVVANVDEQPIGHVTSAGFLPSTGNGIGFALIDSRFARRGHEILIDVRGRFKRAVIASTKFLHEGTNGKDTN